MLRKTLGKSIGAVVLGLSLAKDVQAQDTGYSDLSQAESFHLVHERVKSVSYDTWQKEIIGYDGAVIILFNSSCNTTENADNLDKNMNIVFLQLMDKFTNAKVNGLPLKFTAYNVCGEKKADLLGIVNGIETRMYLDGQKIDVRVGGPLEVASLEVSTRAMTDWISSNLLKTPVLYKGEQKRVVFNGQYKAQLVSFEQ